MDQLKEIIRMGKRDYKWRQQNTGGAHAQIETEVKGIILKVVQTPI